MQMLRKKHWKLMQFSLNFLLRYPRTSIAVYGSLNSHFYSDVHGFHSMNSEFTYEINKEKKSYVQR